MDDNYIFDVLDMIDDRHIYNSITTLSAIVVAGMIAGFFSVKVKKEFNEKVGHTGTLDPNATGVLPLLIGKGTKLSKYLIEHDKIYKATLKLGIKTDTLDITGKILQTQDISKDAISTDIIEKILQTFKRRITTISTNVFCY